MFDNQIRNFLKIMIAIWKTMHGLKNYPQAL